MHNDEGAGWGRHSVVRLSIPQGQRLMFAGNEGYYARLSPAPATSPVTPKPGVPPKCILSSRVVTAFLQVFPPGRGQESPYPCPVAARPHSQPRARATGFRRNTSFRPQSRERSRWGNESPKWLGTPPVVPRLGVTRKKMTLPVFT